MDKQIFPIVEFNKNVINFQIVKYFNDQAIIIYKNIYILDEFEILDKDQIKDNLNIYKFLANCFSEFEKNSSFLKIKQVGLIISNSINITKKMTNLDLKSKDKKTISNTNLDYIIKKINKLQLEEDTNLKILDSKLIELQVNNQIINHQKLDKYFINNDNTKLVMIFFRIVNYLWSLLFTRKTFFKIK
ncbi:hypothetical protein V2P58_01725 [Mycoplasma capricolum subsp. capricolum]|uniref:hypothetical protein n=1 Tax=Mycoplasma capricolum TaxID=2095 RepID=UPI003DA35192